MAQFNIADAKARLSELMDRAHAGEEVIVARNNKPLLKIVPVGKRGRRRPGSARGRIRIAKDFDAPLLDFKMAAVRSGARHAFPTGNIDQMLAEIDRGYQKRRSRRS